MDPPIPSLVENILKEAYNTVRQLEFKIEIWKKYRDSETRGDDDTTSKNKKYKIFYPFFIFFNLYLLTASIKLFSIFLQSASFFFNRYFFNR